MFQIINPTKIEFWDDQVSGLPGASFFHGTAWAKVLAKSYGLHAHLLHEGGGVPFRRRSPYGSTAAC